MHLHAVPQAHTWPILRLQVVVRHPDIELCVVHHVTMKENAHGIMLAMWHHISGHPLHIMASRIENMSVEGDLDSIVYTASNVMHAEVCHSHSS